MSTQNLSASKSNVFLIHLENKNGLSAGIITAGGRLVYLKVPDRNSNLIDVVAAYTHANDYEKAGNPYFGAIIGRVSNRIRNAEFTFENNRYTLEANNDKNCLHGGLNGFQTINWTIIEETGSAAILQHISPAGTGGFPGELTVNAKFELTDNNEFIVEFTYFADETTPVSLTYHPYFNLTGYREPTVLNHELQLNSTGYLPLDKDFTCNNEAYEVTNTPFDFQTEKLLKTALSAENEQLKLAHGFDHNFIVKNYNGEITEVASLYAAFSGIALKVYTDYPGIHVYTSNYDESRVPGKNKEEFSKHHSICLEPQFFPNSSNYPVPYSPYIQANKNYKKTICYKFSNIK